jgi:hypothetical protein
VLHKPEVDNINGPDWAKLSGLEEAEDKDLQENHQNFQSVGRLANDLDVPGQGQGGAQVVPHLTDIVHD